ncbi:MAG TPA: enoyl-CoA hydratase [Roseiarcus sp.]|jgi:enoyl-CoA hydratase/carnithine racemase|nr:enoyl-CoA hydratase [Roseiarcus sp.]
MTPSLAEAGAPNLLREDRDSVATLVIKRQSSRNSLSLEMIETLAASVAAIAEDKKIRAVVLTARGPVFSSGHDLREIRAHRNDADRGRGYDELLMKRCGAMMQAIVALPKPVVAAIEGVATAAGCQLVATCDLAIAGEEARFALSGLNVGLFCSTPLVAVGRVTSRKHAMEMAMTGELYSARDAERFGLVNRVVPAGAAEAEAMKLALGFAKRSAKALAIGKRAFYRQIETPLDEAYASASAAMVDNLAERDTQEAISAFLDKRAPRWEEE